ncbi:hypothetical protein Tco_0916446 [Tanacetum coccineum]
MGVAYGQSFPMPKVEILTSEGPPPIIPMEDMPYMLLKAVIFRHPMDSYFTGCVNPFVRWIEAYPLPDELKMPSHVGSYDGKRDPDNYLHLFKGAIHMQKWAMPVAYHMFTYTLKDSARI